MREMELLTFDILSDLLEENKFESEDDQKIVKYILASGNDWRIPLETLNQFVVVLENEIEGSVTKDSLNQLLKKYNRNIEQFAWEVESICQLVLVFELTEETNLRLIISNLIKKITLE